MEIDFVYDYKVTQGVQKQTVNLQENQAISARKIKEVFQKRRKKSKRKPHDEPTATQIWFTYHARRM